MRLIQLALIAAVLSPFPANALSVFSRDVEQTGDFLSIAGFPAGVDIADIVIEAVYKADDVITWYGDSMNGDTAFYNYSQFEFRITDPVSRHRAVFVAEPTDWSYDDVAYTPGIRLDDGQCGGVETLETAVSMGAVPTPLDQSGGVTLNGMSISARGECDTIGWDPSDEIDFGPYPDVHLSITISDASGREGTLSGPKSLAVPLPAPLALALVPAAALLLLRRRLPDPPDRSAGSRPGR